MMQYEKQRKKKVRKGDKKLWKIEEGSSEQNREGKEKLCCCWLLGKANFKIWWRTQKEQKKIGKIIIGLRRFNSLKLYNGKKLLTTTV